MFLLLYCTKASANKYKKNVDAEQTGEQAENIFSNNKLGYFLNLTVCRSF